MPGHADMFRLDGRRALVIGAGSGIGRESALALAAHGASVVCADRDGESAAATALLAGGTTQVLDVLDREAVFAAADQWDDTDVLVYTPATNVRKRLTDYTGDEVDRVLALNLRAPIDLLRAFGRTMAARGRGSIIGLASIRAFVTEPGQGPYAASKAGLVALFKTAAAELGPFGVRANTVAPGVVDTPLTRQITAVPAWRQAYARKTALGRWSRADEIAGAVVYLAGDAASYVTGSCLVVDGGWTAVDGRFDPFEQATGES